MHVLFAALLTGGRPEPDPGEEAVQAWVAAARQGDDGAAQRLYAAYVGPVYRAVRPWCDSDAQAEDVTQDTFVKALTSLQRYRPIPGKRFLGWLMTIARNTARNRARRAGRAAPTEPARLDRLAEDAAGSSGAADPLGDAHDLARMRGLLLEALAELPERDRQVVTLRYGAGLEAREVADLLGLSPANVRKICERRRATLLARLGPALEPAPAQETAP